MDRREWAGWENAAINAQKQKEESSGRNQQIYTGKRGGAGEQVGSEDVCVWGGSPARVLERRACAAASSFSLSHAAQPSRPFWPSMFRALAT
jgi:hypothetical protein